MTAMLATLEVVSDSHWFPDSGATNHCTPTIHNLTNKSTYDGLDQVYMGNGEDHSTRYSWLYPLHTKSKALSCFIKFKTMVELQLGTYIKLLQTNGRGEFKAFHIFLQSCGILHCTSCPHVHEQNGLAEQPCSTSEALSVLEWHAAMEQEFQAFYSNHTWSLVPPPLNHQVMGCKRVFKVKTNFDGSVNKYKARLVVKGFYQVLHFDFHDTYSPVIKPTTIRAVLALAISNNWTIKQLDFNNTFLNGILKENVYMSQPPGKLSYSGCSLITAKYITEILHKACMDGAKPTPTPMVTGVSLLAYVRTFFEDPHLYRSIVGSFQYATITRPEITFAINRVSQFMQQPLESHWEVVKRILHYLKGTSDHGLLFNSHSYLKLVAFSDVD
ncbi:hypothetical protein AAG906_010084 [Vitis piasezkii]